MVRTVSSGTATTFIEGQQNAPGNLDAVDTTPIPPVVNKGKSTASLIKNKVKGVFAKAGVDTEQNGKDNTWLYVAIAIIIIGAGGYVAWDYYKNKN